ncbi:MAG: PDC sensor domain-containing protein, partial [Candidatus Bipolaricaulia bacterium]
MFFKSLRAKTVLSALIPTALVMVVVAIIGLYAYERAARDVVQQRDAELARVSAARLSEALSRYSRVLLSVAAEDDLQSMEPARLSSVLEEAQNRLYVFDAGVVIYNSEGIALGAQPLAAERRGTHFPVKSEFDKVRRTLRPVFSNVFRDAISGEEVILVAVPIVGSDGGFRGILSGMFKMKYPLLGAI